MKKTISDILWELIPHENKFVITEKDILDYITNLEKENKRLNNIINKLEKLLIKRIKDVPETMAEAYEDEFILDKIKELENGRSDE